MNRKVSLAIVAAIAASASSAFAETPTLTLQPTVATMDDAAAPATRAPLMYGLDKLGAASTLDKYGLNIYGWVEGSYTWVHRKVNRESSVEPVNGIFPNKVGPNGSAPFNHEAGDTFMMNQVDIRFVRDISNSVAKGQFDVGGLVEVMYGQDAAAIHANGLEYGNVNGGTATNASTTENGGLGDRYSPNYQFDIPQAYITVSSGVKGLSFMAGKFVTRMSLETIEPDTNPLFSHSYLFYSVPFTHVGVMGDYQLNDQWKISAGVTRGWDQATEDAPNCAVDGMVQVVYTPNTSLTFSIVGMTGPENFADTSHYRTSIDPTVTWKVTDQLSLAAEVLYIYDGNYRSTIPAGYGDVWGAAVYGAYKINDNFTVNARVEKAHIYTNSFSLAAPTRFNSAVNIYEITLGVTITPFPKDPFGQGLKIRPEIRYDYSEDHIFDFTSSSPNGGGRQDQLTLGADIIYSF